MHTFFTLAPLEQKSITLETEPEEIKTYDDDDIMDDHEMEDFDQEDQT